MLVVPQPAVVLDYLGLVEPCRVLGPRLVGKLGPAADDCDIGERCGLFVSCCFILIYHQNVILAAV